VGEYVCAALTRLEVEKGLKLSGRVLGIIGYGHVGKNLAAKAEALGLKTLVCDPPLCDLAKNDKSSLDTFSPLETVLEKSDIISLHVPLVKDGPYPTLGMVNVAFFQKLSRPVVLLNTCRGEVIHEPDLLGALQAGLIRHLVLDVFAGEPNINSDLCAAADIITPHIAGYSLQGKVNGTVQVYQAFCRFFGFAPSWKLAYPEPANAEIRYPSTLESDPISDVAFRQSCISTAYDMLADENRLRQSFQTSEPGKTFDALRRQYPIRHEFAKFLVCNVPREKWEFRSQLAKLGFRVQ
jgi:erythronate-4-phosphate dehydrogenase